MKFTFFHIRHKLLFCAILFSYLSFAQDLERQLTLVRPFEPSVGDAQKITTLPNLQDTFSIRPSFVYSIRSRRIDTRFDVTPIAPVRLQPIEQPKLYNGYIKIGAGTLPNLLTEVAVNTVRNREYAAGALFKLDMASGDVKLGNDIEVAGNYSDISGKVFGKRFFRNNSILFGELGASGQTAQNYGYDTNLPINPEFQDDYLRKRYFFGDANIGLRSSHFRTDRLNYDVQLDYKLAHNKIDDINKLKNNVNNGEIEEKIFSENAFRFKTQLDNNMFGGNLQFDHFGRSDDFEALHNNFALSINPWFMLDNDSVQMKVGMRAAMYREGEGNLQYAIFPSIEFQFTLLKDIFIPFLGIDGYMQPNTYRSTVKVNPFITPGLTAPMSKTKLQIYAGLKGTIMSKLSYYLRADYSNTDTEHFFVNDPEYSKYEEHFLQNHFTVVIDTLQTFSFKGELYFNPIESVDLGLKANYFKYTILNEQHAWHKPKFTLDFLAKYNFRNKIIANFDVMYIGQRYAKGFAIDPADPTKIVVEPINLEGALVFNLGAEYRYTRSFSLFMRLNNVTGARYDRWNFYPSRGINAMFGFTYSL